MGITCKVCEENESDHWLELWEVFSHLENKKTGYLHVFTSYSLHFDRNRKKKKIYILLHCWNNITEKLYENSKYDLGERLILRSFALRRRVALVKLSYRRLKIYLSRDATASLKAMWNTMECKRESTTEAISLALHSVSHALNVL